MYKLLKKNFFYLVVISLTFGGCSNPIYNLNGYNQEVVKSQYALGTVTKDIVCKGIYDQGFSNLDMKIKKGSILVGEKLAQKEFKFWDYQGVFSSDIKTIPLGKKVILQGEAHMETVFTPSENFYNHFYNQLIVDNNGKPLNILRSAGTGHYSTTKCTYLGNESPIKITYNEHNKNAFLPKRTRKKKENGNFLAKLAGSALMVAAGSGAMGGQASAQSTQLAGAALQDIWNDDKNKESEFNKVLQKQKSASVSNNNNSRDVVQDMIDDSNRMVDDINQNIRNEKIKKAEMERDAAKKHQNTSTAYKRQVQRANNRIARAEKRLANAKAHDRAMRRSADNARKVEEARKLAKIRQQAIDNPRHNREYSRTANKELAVQSNNNSINSVKDNTKQITIAYCWGKTNSYSKKKRFKCSGRIQLSLYPEDAQDKSDEARAVSAQLDLVGCTGKVGVNRSYDLGQATVFPVQSERKFPDFIGEGIDNGAWFKCYDHRMEGGDNSPGRVSRHITDERAKR